MILNRFMCPVAVHLILIENGRLLMLRRKNTGFADGMYGLPAGCIEGNEPVSLAMCREAKEEAGIIIKPEDLFMTTVIHRKDNDWESIAFFFKVDKYEGEVMNCEPEKCDDLRFIDLHDLPSNTIPYVRLGIENSLKKKYFQEWGWN